MGEAAPVVLWQLDLSHFNEKVRWALDFKGVEHERRTLAPGTHRLVTAALTRGRTMRLPVARIDGRLVPDSTAIILALESYRPDPPLLPADPAQRRRALELEDHFDEVLGPATRTFGWAGFVEDPDAAVPILFGSLSPGRQRLARRAFPLIAAAARRDFRATPAGGRAARQALMTTMDRVERELQPSGYLVGDAFSVADLTAAALFTPVLAPAGREHLPPDTMAAVLELREELDARPGGRWVHEMFERHRHPRGASRARSADR